MATISTSHYNLLPTIHEQHEWSQTVSIPSILQHLGSIFEAHDIQEFAAVLVHRHCILPSKHGIVHMLESPSRKACKAILLEDQAIYPCVYQLRADAFEPYEFSSAPTRVPTDTFLRDLAAYLHDHDLSSHIGISYVGSRPSRGHIWVETQVAGEEGAAIRILAPERCMTIHHTVTEWILADEGHTLKTLTVCDDRDPAHKRKP